jgi:cytochrome P450
MLATLQWDERLFTLDPISMAHIMKRSDIYEKPWQSRSLITGLIGCGMLAAEGVMHKRQRRVASPAFSLQNLRALVPLVFKKGTQLRDTWIELLERDIISNDEATVSSLVNDRLNGVEEKKEYKGVKLDVAMWVSRATFDVIGLAGTLAHISITSQSLTRAPRCRFRVQLRLDPRRIKRTVRSIQGHVRDGDISK